MDGRRSILPGGSQSETGVEYLCNQVLQFSQSETGVAISRAAPLVPVVLVLEGLRSPSRRP
eukprot:6211673-Alexandrium_andersonii.AAC.1